MANTKDEILARMLAAIPSDLDKSEGSYIYDVLAAAAIEIAGDYENGDDILALGFAETTKDTYLDYRAHEHGIYRKSATAATGSVTISGTVNTSVPAGSLFATSGGVQFATAADAIIGTEGTVNASIIAVVAGTSGNVPTGTITVIPVSIAGVTSVTNAYATTGGTAQETDVALLARLLSAVQEPATSGNTYHYKAWATSVSGIGSAKILPLWNGAGTVKVVVIDSNMQPASLDLVQDVSDYIETVRPIGAMVTYVSATGLGIAVTAMVTLEAGAVLANVQIAFIASLTAYLKGIAFSQSYVSYAQIGSLLLDTAGVLDYTNLQVNGGTANVVITDTQVAIAGTVTLS